MPDRELPKNGDGAGPDGASRGASPGSPHGAASRSHARAASSGSGRALRNHARDAIRIATGAALVTLIAVAAHPTVSDPTEGALLRIAIRTTAGTVSDCRKLTQQELDALPMHMRRPEVCETRAVPYRLEVSVGGTPMLDRTYKAAGIHGDRPLTVDEEIGLAAGKHDVTVRFTPDPDVHAAKPPPSFAYTGAVELTDGRIRVATLNAAGTGFEIR